MQVAFLPALPQGAVLLEQGNGRPSKGNVMALGPFSSGGR